MQEVATNDDDDNDIKTKEIHCGQTVGTRHIHTKWNAGLDVVRSGRATYVTLSAGVQGTQERLAFAMISWEPSEDKANVVCVVPHGQTLWDTKSMQRAIWMFKEQFPDNHYEEMLNRSTSPQADTLRNLMATQPEPQ